MKKNRKQKGAAIVLVMILCMAAMIILGSLLHRGAQSTRITHMNDLMHEAKYAAESFAEYGAADVITRFQNKTSFPANELINNPIQVPANHTGFFADSRVDLAKSEVQGGQIPGAFWLYVDPSLPTNQADPMRGQKIYVREIGIYGKGTAVSPSIPGHQSVAYVRQTLQVRDCPLFNNAIFYNMDLELNPGYDLDIYGMVHTNADLWVGVNTDYTLSFHEPVNAVGRIFHGYKRYSKTKDPMQSGTEINSGHIGDVRMQNDEGNWQPMAHNGGNTDPAAWLDSRWPTWKDDASNKWDMRMKDASFDVQPLNPAGIGPYVPDNRDTADVNELENHAYALIEPVLPDAHTNKKSDIVRNQKMMARAGLIFVVAEDAAATNRHTIKAYRWERNNMNVPVNTQNPFDGNLKATLEEVQIPIGAITVTNADGATLRTGMLIGQANPGITLVDPSVNTPPRVERYEFDGTNVTGGLYDHRQDQEVSLVTLDVSVLRQMVDDRANVAGTNLGWTYWRDAANKVTFDPTKDWNGVVYVQFPLEATARRTADGIVRARPLNNVGGTVETNLALQLINGEFVPSPSFTPNPGFTVATNGPMYVLGHYNADGIEHTDDATQIETNHYRDLRTGAFYPEPPAAFFADTVTLLSPRWATHNRALSFDDDVRVNPRRDASNSMEVSAAIVTGITPTVGAAWLGNNWESSGGAINLPRFLERWGSSRRLTLRTSMVALYENEVQTQPYRVNFNHFYIPPQRDWGFNANFGNGIFPPGTPIMRTFYRTRFEDITKEQYDNR